MKSLFVKQFVDEGLGNSSYLIASEETGRAAVIDPQRDVDKYLQAADGLGLKLTYALDTHLHADFVSGAHELAHQLGLTHTHEHFQIGASTQAQAEFKHIALHEGDRLALGDLSIGVIDTPGHSPEHISFGVFSEEGKTPEVLFSGGSLIVGGTGRTDLLGQEHASPLAHELYHTLHHKLVELPDDVVIYPTHGAGSFCSTASSAGRFTTLGQERQTNPFLNIHDEEEFVQYALSGLQNYPTYYRHMRGLNQKGACVLGGIPVLEPVSPESAYEQIKAGAVILDVRETHRFIDGHISGSYGIPLVTPLITWAGWVIPFGSPIILVADTTAERQEAARQLIRIGYDDIRGFLQGGVKAWESSGFPVTHTQHVSAAHLNDWLQQKDAPLLLDVRFNKEWRTGHIRNARHVEAGLLIDVARTLVPSDRPVVVHCQRGNRSTVAVSILEQKGFKNVYALDSGIQSWKQAGYEVVLNGNHQ